MKSAAVEMMETGMRMQDLKRIFRDDEQNIVPIGLLFGFAAVLLMLLAIVPQPAVVLLVFAFASMGQLTRMLGQRLCREFIQ